MPVVALCVVGLRRPFTFVCPTCSFNPAALHSHHPRYPLLAYSARPMQFCLMAALTSSRSICTEPHSPPELHWLHPQRGTRRKTRMVFALLPAMPESGQDCPAFRPGQPPHYRTRQKWHSETGWGHHLQERVALRRHPGYELSPQSTPVGQHPLDPLWRSGGDIPRRACFDYRRRARPFSLRKLGFSGVASLRGRTL